MLSALQGLPIRTGTGLLKYLALSAAVPNFVRLECLQVLEASLSESELDELLQRIEGESTEIEAWLLAMAVQRRRPIPLPWLAHRLRTTARLPDKTMLLTVVLVMSVQHENRSADVDKLLVKTMRTALSSQTPRHADLAGAFHKALEDIPADHDRPPTWIDDDLCQRLLRAFVSRDPDVSAERVMLAAGLLGRIPTIESGELLRQCLSGCRDRLNQSLTEMQVKLLMEVALAISRALAELDPQALLAFPADWQPVDGVLDTLSDRRGWLVFNDRILDSEGQQVLAPWQVDNVQFDVDGGDTALSGTELASAAELFERQVSNRSSPASNTAEDASRDVSTASPPFLERFPEFRSKSKMSCLKALVALYCGFERSRASSLNEAAHWLGEQNCPLPRSVSHLSDRLLDLNLTIQDLWEAKRPLFPDFVKEAELQIEERGESPAFDPDEQGGGRTILGLSAFGKWLCREAVAFLRTHDKRFALYSSFLPDNLTESRPK